MRLVFSVLFLVHLVIPTIVLAETEPERIDRLCKRGENLAYLSISSRLIDLEDVDRSMYDLDTIDLAPRKEQTLKDTKAIGDCRYSIDTKLLYYGYKGFKKSEAHPRLRATLRFDKSKKKMVIEKFELMPLAFK